MGRIVRRYGRFFELEMRGNLEQGLPGARLTQYEAGQYLHQIALSGTALGGNFGAASYNVYADVTSTGVPRGLHVRMHVADGVVITGSTYGLHIEQEIVGTGEITIDYEGIRMEQYSPGTTTLNIVYGIFMTNYIQSAPTSYFFQRMSENGGVTVDAAFYISTGGGSDMTNLFYLPGANTAWNPAGDITGGATAGFIQVWVGGIQKRIQLYTA